ncbi:MAG: hypothetical protein AAB685_03385 [Patescibacteria group bacterium]
MNKKILFHLWAVILFFTLITIVKRAFSLNILVFWVGGLIGSFLPFLDHFIYIYFLKSEEQSSSQSPNLIFHTIYFQAIFLILTFLVVSSSSNLLGKGIVLAFSLSLLVDQLVDLLTVGNLTSWSPTMAIFTDKNKSTLYVLSLLAGVIFLAFFI